MPVWFYVKQSGVPADDIAKNLQQLITAQPISRTALVRRLLRKESSFKAHLGKPARICAGFARGIIEEPSVQSDIIPFANAIMTLSADAVELDRLKPILLQLLDRSQGDDSLSQSRRSVISRAACRLDEILHGDAA